MSLVMVDRADAMGRNGPGGFLASTLECDDGERPRSRIEEIRDRIGQLRDESEEDLSPKEIVNKVFDEMHTGKTTDD